MKYIATCIIFVFTLLLIEAPVFGSSCPVRTQRAYKQPDIGTVWYVTKQCTRKPFTNQKMYFTYFDFWGSIRLISEKTLATIPLDAVREIPLGPKHAPKRGSVIKSQEDAKVYFISGNKKHWITSEEVFVRMGFDWDWVESVHENVVANYTEGELVTVTPDNQEPLAQPYYALVKEKNSSEVYRIEPDKRDPRKKVLRKIKNEELLSTLQHRLDRIIEIHSEKLPLHVEGTDGEVINTTIINPFQALSTESPLLGVVDAHSINVEEATQQLQDQIAEESGYVAQTQPIYAIDFEHPETVTPKRRTSALSVWGAHELSLLATDPETQEPSVNMALLNYDEMVRRNISDAQRIQEYTLEEFVQEYVRSFLTSHDVVKYICSDDILGEHGKSIATNTTTNETTESIIIKGEENAYIFSITYTPEKAAEARQKLSDFLVHADIGV